MRRGEVGMGKVGWREVGWESVVFPSHEDLEAESLSRATASSQQGSQLL